MSNLYEKDYNKTEYHFRTKSIKKIDNKTALNLQKNKLGINTNNNKLFSSAYQNFRRNTPLTKLTKFTGFFFKSFNLTEYKKERENSRSRSLSHERIYKPHKPRGNGIPEDILERTRFLSKIFNSNKFLKFYKNRPKKEDEKFDNIIDYILSYRKQNSELETVMMIFYFICHEIKFDVNAKGKKTDNKYAQKPDEVFERGKALSLGFTNIFEYMLKKIEVKFKHIEGYCKKLPPNNKCSYSSNSNNNTNNNTSNNLKIDSPKTKNLISNIRLSLSSGKKHFHKVYNDKEIINHCWNAVFIKGKWYFVDVLLGSGGIQGYEKSFKKDDEDINSYDYSFSPFYFMTPPKYLIISHRPTEDLWQFNEKTYSFKQFMRKSYNDISPFYRGVFEHNIEFITHNIPIIKITNQENLIIKLRLKDYILGGDLYNQNGIDKLSEIKYSYDEENNIFIFEPSFPNNGEFVIRITARPIVSNDLIYRPLLDYIVKIKDVENFTYFNKYGTKITPNKRNGKNDEMMFPKLHNQLNLSLNQPKIISDYLSVFPSKYNKKICYDDEVFHLIEPKRTLLKKGSSVKFKIRISGTSCVAVLDGNKMFNLKRVEKNIYEGEKEIETDNVSLCCLRGKIFTELYKFKSFKEKSVDSKMFMIKIKKKK